MSLSLLGGAAPAFGALNVYWGQWGGHRLRDICDRGTQYVSVAFVTKSPENAGGYPATNFGANCGAKTYVTVNGVKTELLVGCDQIKEDIPYCQSKGVKVLLSLGGGVSEMSVSSDAKGEEFGDFLYKAFGPYQEGWTGPRPFDKDPDTHVSVDGFDLDIEQSLTSIDPYIALVQALRKQPSRLLITAAPQCYFRDQLMPLIQAVEIDILFIQFYNNPSCEFRSGGIATFDAWALFILGGESKNAKIFAGLPGGPAAGSPIAGSPPVDGPAAAGSGYLRPSELKQLVCTMKARPAFGGISLWEAKFALDNNDQGSNYIQAALNALKYGCDTVPSTSSSSTLSSSSSTTTTASSEPISTSSSSSLSTAITVSSASSSTIASSAPTTAMTSEASTSVQGLTPTSSNSASVSVPESSQKATLILSTGGSTSTLPRISTSSFHWANTTRSTSTTANTATQSTSDAKTTKVSIVTSCPPYVVGCSTGQVITKTGGPSDPEHWVTEPVQSQPTTQTEGPGLTTSTVFTTRIHTVTACPSSVPDCPQKGKVITEISSLYVTVCPITQSTGPSQVPQATVTQSPALTTSTVFTTRIHTVTACPNNVPDCPQKGKVITEISSLYVTVCPVTQATGTSQAPQATITQSPALTTSTVYMTKVHTITACPGKATDCSEKGKIITKVVPAYVTTLTVSKVETETAKVAQPTSGSPGSSPSEVPAPKAQITLYSTIRLHKVKTAEIPAPSTATAPGPSPNEGCSGPGCPGVAVPTNGPNNTPTVPSANVPATAGASNLIVSLAGLAAVFLIQVLAM